MFLRASMVPTLRMYFVEGGMWNVECGMWNVEGGMWNVEGEMSGDEEWGVWRVNLGAQDW